MYTVWSASVYCGVAEAVGAPSGYIISFEYQQALVSKYALYRYSCLHLYNSVLFHV